MEFSLKEIPQKKVDKKNKIKELIKMDKGISLINNFFL